MNQYILYDIDVINFYEYYLNIIKYIFYIFTIAKRKCWLRKKRPDLLCILNFFLIILNDDNIVLSYMNRIY